MQYVYHDWFANNTDGMFLDGMFLSCIVYNSRLPSYKIYKRF